MKTKNLISESKYRSIARDLRQRIVSGELKPGDRLPTYTELRAAGIAQPTMDRAHALLEREGLILRHARRGTFVAPLEMRFKSSDAAAGSNAVGASLMRHTVAVINEQELPDVQFLKNEGWHYMTARGVSDALRKKHINILLLQPDLIISRDIAHLRSDAPLGFVVMDMETEREKLEVLADVLHTIDAPVVCGGDYADAAAFDRVTSDHAEGAYQLTRWLIDQRGRRRILHLWPEDCHHYWFHAKQIGYQRAMQESGFDALTPLVVPTQRKNTSELSRHWFDHEVRVTAGFLAEHLIAANPVDAVMAHTDYVAYIAAAACRILGLRPNQDVDVTGYDNYWEENPLRAWEPAFPIATVDKRNLAIGEQLVQTLDERISGRAPHPPKLVLVPPGFASTQSQAASNYEMLDFNRDYKRLTLNHAENHPRRSI